MAEWQAVMSSREFSEWMAFSQLQPFGEWRSDYRTATLMALIANAMTRSKDSDPVKAPGDFMEQFDFEKALDEREAQEEVPEHERVWNKVKSAFGGLVKPRPSLTPSPSPSGEGNKA